MQQGFDTRRLVSTDVLNALGERDKLLNTTLTQTLPFLAVRLIFMTLQAYQAAYQALEQWFQQLQVKLTQEEISGTEVKADLRQVQSLQQQIGCLPATSLDEAVSLQLASIQTEVNKQLRLLETDSLFLQTARQSATTQQRKQQMQERLSLLLRYCEAILALLQS